jgi:hypothetical protein
MVLYATPPPSTRDDGPKSAPGFLWMHDKGIRKDTEGISTPLKPEAKIHIVPP